MCLICVEKIHHELRRFSQIKLKKICFIDFTEIQKGKSETVKPPLYLEYGALKKCVKIEVSIECQCEIEQKLNKCESC